MHQQSATSNANANSATTVASGRIATRSTSTDKAAVAVTSEQQKIAQTEAKSAVASLKTLASTISMAGAVVGTVSQIIDEIRDKWDDMSDFQRFFAVVGAVAMTAALGYFSWKAVSGNWDAIVGAVEGIEENCEALFTSAYARIQNTPVINQLMRIFSEGIEVPDMKITPDTLTSVLVPLAGVGGSSTVIQKYFTSFAEIIKASVE